MGGSLQEKGLPSEMHAFGFSLTISSICSTLTLPYSCLRSGTQGYSPGLVSKLLTHQHCLGGLPQTSILNCSFTYHLWWVTTAFRRIFKLLCLQIHGPDIQSPAHEPGLTALALSTVSNGPHVSEDSFKCHFLLTVSLLHSRLT